MRILGMLLLIISIISEIAILVYKNMKGTLMFIGPKTLVGFIVCTILTIVGIRLLLKSKKPEAAK